MAAKTIKEAFTMGLTKHEMDQGHLEADVLSLRNSVLAEIRDYMAHEFLIYSSQATNSIKDPELANFVNMIIIRLFERIFPERSSINIEELRNEYKKGN